MLVDTTVFSECLVKNELLKKISCEINERTKAFILSHEKYKKKDGNLRRHRTNVGGYKNGIRAMKKESLIIILWCGEKLAEK